MASLDHGDGQEPQESYNLVENSLSGTENNNRAELERAGVPPELLSSTNTMDIIHKSKLLKARSNLVADLNFSEIKDGLLQNGAITGPQYETIKEEATRGQKIQKLLDILPRRGPDAYGKFKSCLQNDSPWLVKHLDDLTITIDELKDYGFLDGKHVVQPTVEGDTSKKCEDSTDSDSVKVIMKRTLGLSLDPPKEGYGSYASDSRSVANTITNTLGHSINMQGITVSNSNFTINMPPNPKDGDTDKDTHKEVL